MMKMKREEEEKKKEKEKEMFAISEKGGHSVSEKHQDHVTHLLYIPYIYTIQLVAGGSPFLLILYASSYRIWHIIVTPTAQLLLHNPYLNSRHHHHHHHRATPQQPH